MLKYILLFTEEPSNIFMRSTRTISIFSTFTIVNIFFVKICDFHHIIVYACITPTTTASAHLFGQWMVPPLGKYTACQEEENFFGQN